MTHKPKKPINKELLAKLTDGKSCDQPLFNATVKNLLKTTPQKHIPLREKRIRKA